MKMIGPVTAREMFNLFEIHNRLQDAAVISEVADEIGGVSLYDALNQIDATPGSQIAEIIGKAYAQTIADARIAMYNEEMTATGTAELHAALSNGANLFHSYIVACRDAS